MRLSRPGLAGLGIAVFAAIVAVQALRDGDDEDTGAQTNPTATSTTAATSTGEPSPASGETPAAQDSPLSGPIDDGFVRTDLRPDEMPESPYGIVFADVATGAGEYWRVEGAEDNQGNSYWVDPTHRWLFWVDFAISRMVIADRETGESYELDPQRWSLLAGPTPDGRVVVQKASTRGYAVIELALDPGRIGVTFSLPTMVVGPSIALLRNGSMLRFGEFLIDLNTGEVQERELPEGYTASHATTDGGWLDVTRAADDGLPAYTVQRYDAAGEPIALDADPPLAAAWQQNSAVSPDGRWIVTGTDMGLASPAFTQVWPAFVLSDLRTGEPVFRAVRVAIPSGLRFSPWLADGSALVVSTPAGFAILRPDGTLDPLLLGPVERSGFDGVPIPIPAPHDPSLFVYDGRVVTARGEPASPELAAAAWATHEPWNEFGLNSDGSELRLIQSAAPGKDVGLTILSAFGLPAQIQRPPFPDEVRLSVAAGGDGLNLRAQPNMEAEVVTTLRDGALVTVANSNDRLTSVEPDESAADPDTFAWVYDVPWWVHVVADDGTAGWVRSEFLRWAE